MTATTTAKRFQKPRNVNYTLVVVDDLPEVEVTRRSSLEDNIDKILAADAEGKLDRTKFCRIGSYFNGSAASAAANVLRKRHGDRITVDGFAFQTKRADEDGEIRTGLFVKYDPEQIVEGEKEAFQQRLKDRAAKTAERRAARKAAAADGEMA